MSPNTVKKHWLQVLFEKNKERSNVFLHKIVSEGKTTYHAELLLVHIVIDAELLPIAQKKKLSLEDLLGTYSLSHLKSLSQNTQEKNPDLTQKIEKYFDIVLSQITLQKNKIKFNDQDIQYHGFICRELHRAWEVLEDKLVVLEEQEMLNQAVKELPISNLSSTSKVDKVSTDKMKI